METISGKCPYCDGGKVIVDQQPVDCPRCAGTGRAFLAEVSFDVLLEKIQEIKTKINQMQADINYIRAKV